MKPDTTQNSDTQASMTPDLALEMLLAGNRRFVFRTRSLDKPISEEGGTSRLLHEVVACPVSAAERSRQMDSTAIVKAAKAAGEGAARFVKIVALDAWDPEFDQWCVSRGVDRDRLSVEKLAAEATEFLELDEAALNRLRHVALSRAV